MKLTMIAKYIILDRQAVSVGNIEVSVMQVVDSWVRVALAIIPQMDRAAVNIRIVPFALARAQTHGHMVQGRLMCCALLGAAASSLHGEDIEHQCLQKAVALCQVCSVSLAHSSGTPQSPCGQAYD